MGLFPLVEQNPSYIPADPSYLQKRTDTKNDCQIRNYKVLFNKDLCKEKPRLVAASEVMASADQGRISKYILQGAPGSCKSRAFLLRIIRNGCILAS
jgi:hypothetical protein